MSKTTFSTLDGSPANPAGGARTTANDMIRFLQLLLNNGRINGKRILSEEAVKALRTLTSQTGAIKNAPKMTANWGYTSGSWAVEVRESQATALAAPALYGVLPVVDWCRGYTAVLVTKAILDEPKNNQPTYVSMKEAIDENINRKCN
jgi:CubicO group peptidase (beta-lactamase class C family)